MNRFHSDVITPANCRKILRAWHSGKLGSRWTRGMNKNTIYLTGGYCVAVHGDKIILSREVIIKRGLVQTRSLNQAEIPLCERMFRRLLEQDVERLLGPPTQFKPLNVDLGALVELLALILAAAPISVLQKANRYLRLAVEKPGDWLHKYGHRRGLKKPSEDLYILAFLDAITTARVGCELDHRSGANELARELGRIGRRLGFHVQPPQEDELFKAIPALSRSLKQIDFALILVDIDSDSYPFFVVPKVQLRRVQALMRKLKFQVTKI